MNGPFVQMAVASVACRLVNADTFPLVVGQMSHRFLPSREQNRPTRVKVLNDITGNRPRRIWS